jgi:Fe2+ transport system protein FeoA
VYAGVFKKEDIMTLQIAATTVADLSNNDHFTVKKVMLNREVGKRLADMGFTEGADGFVVRCALLGDPIQINIRGYDVSIRVSEASGIEVEKVKAVSGRGGNHAER